MRQHRSENYAPIPWHVPVAVEDVAETGQHFELVADEGVRAALARLADVRDLPRLEADFDVTRHGAGGLHVAGRVSATVGQTCVVTLEPLTNEIEEFVDLLFVPQAAAQKPADGSETENEPREVKWDDPEPLIDGMVDLGALATELLVLGIDPYPRKPGAVFQPPQVAQMDDGPFAALGKLKKG